MPIKQGFVTGLGKLGRSYWGMVLAHCGLAVLIAGITLVSFHEVERDIRMAPGDDVQSWGTTALCSTAWTNTAGPTSIPPVVISTFHGRINPVAVMHPEKRTYHASRQVMTEAAIDAGFWRDLYVALGEPLDDSNAWAVRIYFKPGDSLDLVGALIMALGGALALTDKRYRRNRFAANDADAANESWLLLVFLPLVGFVLLAVLLASGLGRDPQALPSALVEQTGTVVFPAVVTDRRNLTEESLKGRWQLLNVWATWCPTCHVSIPYLLELAAQGVAIPGLNYKDELPAARQYLANLGNPFTHVIVDADGQLGLDLGVYGAPETFLINPAGGDRVAPCR